MLRPQQIPDTNTGVIMNVTNTTKPQLGLRPRPQRTSTWTTWAAPRAAPKAVPSGASLGAPSPNAAAPRFGQKGTEQGADLFWPLAHLPASPRESDSSRPEIGSRILNSKGPEPSSTDSFNILNSSASWSAFREA